jgi:hypothetical protein
MPANPATFRFAGVDGRGRQELIRDPRNGGPAVVAISDPDPGSEGYTFDIFWGGPDFSRNGSAPPPPPPANRDYGYRDYDDNRYQPDYRGSEYYRRYGHGFAVDDAVQICRDEIYNQARNRFRGWDVHLRRTEIDDRPGRNDWVLGSLDVHRGPREERYNFSCAVNFDNGRVRSAQIDPVPLR